MTSELHLRKDSLEKTPRLPGGEFILTSDIFMMKKSSLILLFVSLCFLPNMTKAEEKASARDRLVVEALVRLNGSSVSGNEKWKGAVERVALADRGEEGYFELVEQFSLKSEAAELVRLVEKAPAGGEAAKATRCASSRRRGQVGEVACGAEGEG